MSHWLYQIAMVLTIVACLGLVVVLYGMAPMLVTTVVIILLVLTR
jgi:hypothetical protein